MKSVIILALLSMSIGMVMSSTKDYDYYAFALEWPGSVCQFKNCVEDHSIGGTWNLHGLWPNANNGHHPFFCTKTPTDWDNLPKDLRDTLGQYWSGLYSSQEKFLDHEWTKHGTCWRTDYGNIDNIPSGIKTSLQKARTDKQNSADFFNFVVDLSRDVYRIYDILSNNGISPSATATYNL
jgi:ribonuclease T2